MPIQKTIFNIKGMTRDMAVSKFTPELAFENKNLRIVATDENTSFGLVNERGTADTGVMIEGTPIGQQIINNSLILFTTESEGNAVITINGIEGINLTLPNASGNAAIEDSSFHGDRIYKFKIDSNGNLVSYPNSVAPFFAGDLGFSKGCPIESIGVYENEEIQKVYWVDGKNQPRVINVSDNSISNHVSTWNNNSFNFVRDVNYGVINITRNPISFGSFAPGVIQYCFTYYDLYGPESNIFYTSPLYYISHISRGANPEEIVSCSFKIDIPVNSYSTKYDYLRIYSILRTSIDATPQVRRVTDIKINKTSPQAISYVDSGVEGETVDPSQLLFIGGEPIFAGTLVQKDNTLFLGDIVAGRLPLSSTIKSACRNITVETEDKEISLPDVRSGGNYAYTSQLGHNNSEITYYKSGECYRVGLQAQHYTGRWSDVAFITDKLLGLSDCVKVWNNSGYKAKVKNLKAVISNTTLINELVDAGYVKVRPVVVFPDANNRNVICQGVLCPTVYNVEDRYNNGPYVQSSWFFRPNAPSNVDSIVDPEDGSSWLEFRHNYPIPQNNKKNAEIQSISSTPPCPLIGAITVDNPAFYESTDYSTWVEQNRECFYVDQSIFTLHSPDVEFGDALKTLDSTALKFRVVGFVPVEASYSDIDIEATAPRNYITTKNGEVVPSAKIAPGFVKSVLTFPVKEVSALVKSGWRSLVSTPMWFDDFADSVNHSTNYPVGFVVYPWQKSGGLNGTPVGGETSQLLHKKMSIMRYSTYTSMLGEPLNMSIRAVSKFDSDEVTMLKLDGPKGDAITYYGNVDKLIVHHSTPKGDWRIRDYKPRYDTGSVGGVIFDSALISSSFPARYPVVVAKGRNSVLQPLFNPREYNSQTISNGDFDKEINNVRHDGSLSNALANDYTYLEDYVDSGYSNTALKQVNKYIFFDTDVTAADPVSMKYKSTPHLVVTLAQTGTSQSILPCLSVSGSQLNYNGGNYDSGAVVFWKDGSFAKTQPVISISSSSGIGIYGNGFLWLGEIYRDDLNNNFGGTSEEELENNKWIPAGEPVSLLNGSENVTSFTLRWTQGDTYYQRYDCLKTYPFTYDDVNSVSDMLSFMCETRINIDGRYDKNRGKLSLLYASPENSNLINPVYSQQNNFFSYRGINSNKAHSGYYPNTITWTKTKTMGETVDSWTGISLASTLDVDGDKGRVRALRRFNNDLIAFQDRGISQILYNENIQIASTAGVPIEIANSGKVSGKRYISNHIGCVNKWSICEAPMGLYFMDDIGKDIYLFDGKLNNLSDKLGFHSWVISNFPNIKVWNPRDFDTAGEITYYDKINGDVLLITGKTALAFSEPLGNFSSFYSYEKTPYLSILNDRGILWHKDDSIQYGQEGYGKYKAWWYREGNYNYFFNTYKPYYTTVVANEHPTEDKIFNNLEYRGDMFEYDSNLNDWVYAYNNTFNKLTTWNEYQEGIANLENITDKVSNLKKKFRIWRANIPRNTENKGGDSTHNYSRDRMRNPWLYIKLCREHVTPGDGENDVTINSKKSVLHDLVVYYFE